MTLNWLDIVLIIICGGAVVAGFAKGFARVGIGFAATITGLLLGIWFYGSVGSYLSPVVKSDGIANFIGFWIIFLVCVIAGGLLGRLLAKLFHWVGLSWFDHLLGGLVGLLQGLVAAVALVLVLVAFTPKSPSRAVVNSRWAPYLMSAAGVIVEMAPRELKDDFVSSYDKLRRIWSHAVDKAGNLPETEI